MRERKEEFFSMKMLAEKVKCVWLSEIAEFKVKCGNVYWILL